MGALAHLSALGLIKGIQKDLNKNMYYCVLGEKKSVDT